MHACLEPVLQENCYLDGSCKRGLGCTIVADMDIIVCIQQIILYKWEVV